MASGEAAADVLPPDVDIKSDAAGALAPGGAAGDAPLRKAPRAPMCAGGPGLASYFGKATPEAVSAQLLLTAAVVLITSIAGDSHGSATKVSLPAVSDRWSTDCATMGISATSANAGLGITALALTVGGTLAGLRAAGVMRLSGSRGAPRSEAGAATLRSLRGAALLIATGTFLAACIGVYAGALGRWLPSLRACAACRKQQLAWLATPRVSAVGRDCPVPQHLTTAPAGMQTIAGLLGCGALLCVSKLGALVAAAVRAENDPLAADVHTGSNKQDHAPEDAL